MDRGCGRRGRDGTLCAGDRAGGRSRGYPGQQRRHHPGAVAAGEAVDEDLGRHRARGPARHLRRLRGLRPAHGRSPARQHHQHRFDRGHAIDADARLHAGQGGGDRHDRMPGGGVGTVAGQGQRRFSRLHENTRTTGRDRQGRAGRLRAERQFRARPHGRAG